MKVGDRVVAFRNYDSKFLIGKQGKINHFPKYDNLVTIEFDDNIGGHDGHFGKDGHCWTMPISFVELIDNYDDDIIWYKNGKLGNYKINSKENH